MMSSLFSTTCEARSILWVKQIDVANVSFQKPLMTKARKKLSYQAFVELHRR